MPPDKAVFDAGEPCTGSGRDDNRGKFHYLGIDRRRRHRRSTADRRAEVRFTTDGDRRRHSGRRHTDAPDKPW